MATVVLLVKQECVLSEGVTYIYVYVYMSIYIYILEVGID